MVSFAGYALSNHSIRKKQTAGAEKILSFMPRRFFQSGRGDWIRTSGLCVPNATLYQAEPHLVITDNKTIISEFS